MEEYVKATTTLLLVFALGKTEVYCTPYREFGKLTIYNNTVDKYPAFRSLERAKSVNYKFAGQKVCTVDVPRFTNELAETRSRVKVPLGFLARVTKE